ncbi:hypothetical protein BOX15_Mlig022546g4 [Macrostomum lignano]|uniref:ubiquitinyl hydrolase 1 n=1 Tax=Macrostomum lignano TaxID=282301 RepID=A0A267E4V8_9PLAT|nr:hypothetical protein BOX15_Mlig022546g4 [Macrostomum lignano]
MRGARANNLLQRPEFTQSQFDQLCQSLSPQQTWLLNPHRNPLGLGNYDANVLDAALQSRGLRLVWFDRRKPSPACCPTESKAS